MKIKYLFCYLLASAADFAQGQSNDYLPSQPAVSGADISSRVVDLEVRQILLERKVKALEEQLQPKGTNESASRNGDRMHPRHIEVIKKDRPIQNRQSEVQYPIYPIVPMPYGTGGNMAPMPPVTSPGP